jgi:ribosome-binding factor A
MAKSYRIERLNASIKALLSELIAGSVKDPRVGFVTINAVEVAGDLETAKVYYTVMGEDEEKAASQKGLESASAFLRKTVGRELKLKNSPALRFIYDDTLDRSMHIEETIRKIHEDEQEDGP